MIAYCQKKRSADKQLQEEKAEVRRILKNQGKNDREEKKINGGMKVVFTVDNAQSIKSEYRN
jgi:hypothetical protein